MKQMIKNTAIFLVIVMLTAVTPVLASRQYVLAVDAAGAACDGVQLIDDSAKCDDAAKAQSGFSDIVKTVINVLSVLVGTVSVIMIIIGGFRYIISGGDSSATKSAKDTILYAVIGLVIVLFAQVIVVFVITQTKAASPTKAPAKKTTYITSMANA